MRSSWPKGLLLHSSHILHFIFDNKQTRLVIKWIKLDYQLRWQTAVLLICLCHAAYIHYRTSFASTLSRPTLQQTWRQSATIVFRAANLKAANNHIYPPWRFSPRFHPHLKSWNSVYKRRHPLESSSQLPPAPSPTPRPFTSQHTWTLFHLITNLL